MVFMCSILITCFNYLISFIFSYGMKYYAKASSSHTWGRLLVAIGFFCLPSAMLMISALLAIALQCCINGIPVSGGGNSAPNAFLKPLVLLSSRHALG